jgi:hypothetical protein
MKRLVAVAVIVAGFALPACAQRSGSHGGFSGHTAQASRGTFSGSAPGRAAASARTAGSRSLAVAPGFRRTGPSNFGARTPYAGAGRYRRPYRSPYRPEIVYGNPGWVSPYILDYPDSFDNDDSQAGPVDSVGGYDAPPPEQNQPEPPRVFPPASDLSPAPSANSDVAVTLVFKDGRPPEQIDNYLLTRTTLYVLDQRRRVIPLDELDLVATGKVNHDAGVDFHLPDSHK